MTQAVLTLLGTEMGKTVVSIKDQIAVLLPIGLSMMALFFGIKLVPKMIQRFAK